MNETQVTATNGGKEALYDLGMMYCIGRDVDVDLVLAHKWLNLAAMRGNDDAKAVRSEISSEMSVGDIPVANTVYPDAEIKELGFSATPLALYEKDFTMTVPYKAPENGPARARLTLQACNEEVCLPPDDMIFWVW